MKGDEFKPGNLLAFAGGPVRFAALIILPAFLVSSAVFYVFFRRVAILGSIALLWVTEITFALDQAYERYRACASDTHPSFCMAIRLPALLAVIFVAPATTAVLAGAARVGTVPLDDQTTLRAIRQAIIQ